MAFTYGSVTNCLVRNGQTRKEYECRLGYEVQSQSIENNTSTIKLRLECRSISSSYTTKGSSGLTSKIDGTTVKNNAAVDMSNTNVWQNFGERTITVTHNNEGKYSASKSGSFTCTAGSSSYSLSSGSASVTVAPATIPRYATVSHSLKSKTSTSVTIDWSSDSVCDYMWYSKDNGANWTAIDIADATSGTYTISGLSPNTTYNIKTSVRRKDSQLDTDSSTLTVTTYNLTNATLALSSKTETSITVTSGANVEVSSTRYRIKKSNETYGAWQTSPTFSGLSAYTYYLIQVEKVGKSSGEYGYAEIAVTTYDYPYCTSSPSFKIGDAVKLDFYNPLKRNISVKILGNNDTVIGTWSGTSDTITGFNDESTVSEQYESIPDKTSSTYKVQVTYNSIVKTRNNGNTYSTKGTEKPTFSNFTYEDTNATTKALTGNNQILIKGYSNLKVTISTANKAYSNYGSPISKYRLNVGSMSSVEQDYSSNAAVALSINAVNSPSITVTAIDKRNYAEQAQQTASFKDYEKPVVSGLAAVRGDGGVGSEVTLAFDGTWWNDNFGKVANTIKNIVYYYKKTTDTTWTKGNTAIIANVNENNFSGSVIIEGPNTSDKGFDVATAYNIKIIITDALASSSEYQTILGTGAPALAIYDNKVSVGLKYDENLGGALQVKGEVVEQGLRVSETEPDLKEKIWIKKGKNALNTKRVVSQTINGVTITPNSDGTITLNGTCTAGFSIVLLSSISEYINGDYIFSLKVNSGNMSGASTRFSINNALSSSPVNESARLLSFVLSANGTNASATKNISDVAEYLSAYINTNCVFNNCNISLQLEQGTKVTEYQSYVEKSILCKNSNGEYENFYNEKQMIKTEVYEATFNNVGSDTSSGVNVPFSTMFPTLNLDDVICFNTEVTDVYETWDRVYANVLMVNDISLRIRSYLITQQVSVRVTAFYR